MEKWKEYEDMAYRIYTQLAGTADVKRNDKIMGKNSKVLRQIDVAIRLNVASHEILIIVQAKDLARPADVNVVGEFNDVIEDVGASKGVLICNAGFTDAAINSAQARKIDLCTAHDSKNVNWAAKIEVPFVWVESEPKGGIAIELTVDEVPTTSVLPPSKDVKKWIIKAGDSLTNIASILDNQIKIQDVFKKGAHAIKLETDGLRLMFSHGYSVPITALEFEANSNPKAYTGSLSIEDCIMLRNISANKTQSRIRIKARDLPRKRDPAWKAIDDWDSKAPNYKGLVLEVTPNSFSDFNFGEFDILKLMQA